ncbi:preprotein translocase subunit SecY [Moraxella catarrhalis]|jgi:preprotein translocase, secY subunit|uniref:Protein translocase subunit SecY n=2 Tax=Moraxella catarrhalis TaxID=480 RepID=A0A3A9MB06_MORCA|nr:MULTISPECIES: preprotein translocase subunit SecY [Moraxella]AIK00171.1 preprotein translocase, SecY subunit [Moraxella catarrhalis]AIT43882.1 SecY protein [Moraxella catarrhalis]ARB66686.1 preprotein translocase subunit SecY [Moraxella catarrhalis]ARE65308.1 preprotein translocase subunit SecY [Moraxella catarrhalis]AVL50114.1 preprotein translocase subunit SecY [Moraxella catarrhalis]
MSRQSVSRSSIPLNPFTFVRKYDELWTRMLFLFGALIVYRLGSHIPVPGMNPVSLANFFQSNSNTFLGMFNVFSGGSLERMSIMALGIMPYISASIVVQMMSAIIPSLEALKKEGESGRRTLNKYTRQGTLALAFVQAVGMSTGLIAGGLTLTTGLSFYIPAVTSLVAGSMFLMWLGEQITERGVGNGISMLILASIIASAPGMISQAFSQNLNLIVMLLFVVLGITVIAAIVFIERAQRRVPVNYAQKQQLGRKIYAQQQSHLPLKINMAGVIPAIFASSLLLLPASLGQWTTVSENPTLTQEIIQNITLVLQPGQPLYLLLFGVMIIFFCYFYTALMFNPKEVAENLKRSGAYIPGIRPGQQTKRYLDFVLNRLTFIGAMYMTIICLMPMIIQSVFNVPIPLGGASLLIMVVVLMDFIAQLQAHLMTHQYHDQTIIKSS